MGGEAVWGQARKVRVEHPPNISLYGICGGELTVSHASLPGSAGLDLGRRHGTRSHTRARGPRLHGRACTPHASPRAMPEAIRAHGAWGRVSTRIVDQGMSGWGWGVCEAGRLPLQAGVRAWLVDHPAHSHAFLLISA